VILKFEGRTEPIDRDPNDVKPQLHETLIEREVQRLVAETFDSLKKKARVDKYDFGAGVASGSQSRREVGAEELVSRETIFELLESKVDEISRLSKEVEQLQAVLKTRQFRKQ
jgi:hypothetical protein